MTSWQSIAEKVTLIVPCKGIDCTGLDALLSGYPGPIEVIPEHTYGDAINIGLSRVTTPFAATMDADGQHDWREVVFLFRNALSHHADLVIGRHTPEFGLRRAASGVLNLTASILAGRHVPDIGSGLRLMRMSAIRSCLPLPMGFDCNAAMTMRMLMTHHKVIWMMAHVNPRRSGKSHIRMSDGWQTLRTLRRSSRWKPR